MNSSPLTAVASLLHAHSPISLQVFPLLPLLHPFFSIFQGQRCYYTKLDQVTIALCCLTASSLFPIHPIVVVLVTQSCPTLCDTVDCTAPGSSVHGIFQARILEWVAFPFPGDLADPGIKPESPALQADFFFFFFTIWATKEANPIYHTSPHWAIFLKCHVFIMLAPCIRTNKDLS